MLHEWETLHINVRKRRDTLMKEFLRMTIEVVNKSGHTYFIRSTKCTCKT